MKNPHGKVRCPFCNRTALFHRSKSKSSGKNMIYIECTEGCKLSYIPELHAEIIEENK